MPVVRVQKNGQLWLLAKTVSFLEERSWVRGSAVAIGWWKIEAERGLLRQIQNMNGCPLNAIESHEIDSD